MASWTTVNSPPPSPLQQRILSLSAPSHLTLIKKAGIRTKRPESPCVWHDSAGQCAILLRNSGFSAGNLRNYCVIPAITPQNHNFTRQFRLFGRHKFSIRNVRKHTVNPAFRLSGFFLTLVRKSRRTIFLLLQQRILFLPAPSHPTLLEKRNHLVFCTTARPNVQFCEVNLA